MDRFALANTKKAIETEYLAQFTTDYQANFNVTPGSTLPILLSATSKEFVPASWGKKGSAGTWSVPPFISTSRLLTSGHKISIRKRRCMIPASCYYLMAKIGEVMEQPYLVHLVGRRIFSMAGIWQETLHPETEEPEYHFSILTTGSCDILKDISTDMPIILPKGKERLWLKDNLSLQEVTERFHPLASEQVDFYPISARIKDQSFNDKHIMTPIGLSYWKQVRNNDIQAHDQRRQELKKDNRRV